MAVRTVPLRRATGTGQRPPVNSPVCGRNSMGEVIAARPAVKTTGPRNQEAPVRFGPARGSSKFLGGNLADVLIQIWTRRPDEQIGRLYRVADRPWPRPPRKPCGSFGAWAHLRPFS